MFRDIAADKTSALPRLSTKWHFGVRLVKASFRNDAQTDHLEYIVPSVLAIALAIVLSVGAVHLADAYLGPADRAEAHRFPTGGH